MAQRWRIKATKIEGGFSLRLIGDGDLGEALDAGSVIEMEDGRTMDLHPALAELIQSRVVEIVVNMELTGEKALQLPCQLPSQRPEERVH